MAKKIEKKELKDISLEKYHDETDEYYNKALIDFIVIVWIVALTFLIG